MKRLRNNETGIALIMVMWILVLLIALGTEFALSMKTEVDTTRNFKEDAETYHLAKAGLALAKAEILADVQYHSSMEEQGFIFGPASNTDSSSGLSNPSQGITDETEEPAAPEQPSRSELPLGRGLIQYSIQDENGKININTAEINILQKALEANGLSEGVERDEIVDSILDWIDEDDEHRLNGVESDYYERLSPPYPAKNGPLSSLEELLKIKGITPDLFYGSEEYQPDKDSGRKNAPGLQRIFTVQPVSQFNPNTAERVVLEIMYPEEQVDEILTKKDERGWYNKSQSTHFKITATGTLEHSPTRHTVVTLVEKHKTGNKATLLTRYWHDNYIGR